MALAREILVSHEADALVLHGLGRPGMSREDLPAEWKIFLEVEKQQIRGCTALQNELGRPVIIGSHYNPWESQAVSDLNREGIRIYNRLHEIAQLLAAVHHYWENR